MSTPKTKTHRSSATNPKRGASPRKARSSSERGSRDPGSHVGSGTLREYGAALTRSFRDAAEELDWSPTRAVREKPYATLGLAAGVGFLLGGGLSPRILGAAFGLSTRLVINALLQGIDPRRPGSSSSLAVDEDDDDEDVEEVDEEVIAVPRTNVTRTGTA